jgi:hypothetical protein
VLQGQAAYIVHIVPTYEDIVAELRDRFGDQQLAVAYHSQLKATVQTSGEMLQESAVAVMQLAHRAFVGLPVAVIQSPSTLSLKEYESGG